MPGKNNKGVAIIIALLTILVLSTLGAAIIFSTQEEITTTSNFKRLTQARYAAEAGAQSTANWLIYSYTPPTDYSTFDTTQFPVMCASPSACSMGQPIVLSALNGTTANYPDNTVKAAYTAALANQSVSGLDIGVTYSTTATLQTMQVVTPFGGGPQVPLQTWLIRSQATIGGSQAQVEVTTTIEKFGSPVFSYAAFAVSAMCNAIDFAGGAGTDSFDSSLSPGTYSATHENDSGNLGSNGNVNLGGSTTVIHGTVSNAPPYSGTGNCNGGSTTALSTSGGASDTGGQVSLPSTVSFATPAAPSPAPPTTNQNLVNGGDCAMITGCTTLSSGNYSLDPSQGYGNLSISSGNTVHLSHGTYRINSISLAGNSSLIIDSGVVVLSVAGAGLNGGNKAVDFSGGTISNTSSDKPADFQVMYGGTQPVALTGGSGSYGVVYAPAANIQFTGGSDWYGSVIGNTVTDTGGTSIHYDRSLTSGLEIVGNYHATTFGWSKY